MTPASAPWHPGMVVSAMSREMSQCPCVMLIQRAPDDDGWLATDTSGVIFNIFDRIAHHYRPLQKTARPQYVRAMQQPTEWFGMHPTPLRLSLDSL